MAEEEFTKVHHLNFELKDRGSHTLNRVIHEWGKMSPDKLHTLLHDARHSLDHRQDFEEHGVTAIHHSDGHYTLQKTEHH